MSVRDLDQEAAMIACAPFFDGIHGPHRDVLVKAAGGEDVVELLVACCLRALAGKVARYDVAGVAGLALRVNAPI